MIPQHIDNYLLTLDTKYTEEIFLEGGLKLYIDPSFRPEWNCTVVGTVASIPKNNTGAINIGDTVLFSYTVVGQRDFSGIGHVFHSMFDKYNDDFQRFSNGRGEMITIVAFTGVISKIYACCHLDERGRLIGEGMQGSFSQMERWKSQFTFDSGGAYKYKNLLPINSKDYWICRPTEIFAKIVDGELQSVGDRVIMQPLETELPSEIYSQMGLAVPNSSVSVRYYDRAIVLSFGESKHIHNGQIVAFDQKYLEKYEYNSKQYFLIKKKRILGEYKKIS
jgi:co-chaperonin GroES (HSP10)